MIYVFSNTGTKLLLRLSQVWFWTRSQECWGFNVAKSVPSLEDEVYRKSNVSSFLKLFKAMQTCEGYTTIFEEKYNLSIIVSGWFILFKIEEAQKQKVYYGFTCKKKPLSNRTATIYYISWFFSRPLQKGPFFLPAIYRLVSSNSKSRFFEAMFRNQIIFPKVTPKKKVAQAHAFSLIFFPCKMFLSHALWKAAIS